MSMINKQNKGVSVFQRDWRSELLTLQKWRNWKNRKIFLKQQTSGTEYIIYVLRIILLWTDTKKCFAWVQLFRSNLLICKQSACYPTFLETQKWRENDNLVYFMFCRKVTEGLLRNNWVLHVFNTVINESIYSSYTIIIVSRPYKIIGNIECGITEIPPPDFANRTSIYKCDQWQVVSGG